MKLNIKSIVTVFFIILATSGCVEKKIDYTSVNTYAIEKSACFKKDDINNKIINETHTLSVPYPYSVNLLLLSKETISSLIPLGDRGIMSEEYYLNKYVEEQNLIHLMFKKRNIFTTFDITYVKEVNTPLNNKKYDYEIYFDSYTVGELEIYLKENSTNRTFFIWNSNITKIDPIRAIENILKFRLISNAFSNRTSVQDTSSPRDTMKKSYSNVNSIQDTNPRDTMKKSYSGVNSIQDTNPRDTMKKSYSDVNSIQDINAIDTINKSSSKNNSIPYANHNSIIRDYSGCFAYGILNQCVVW